MNEHLFHYLLYDTLPWECWHFDTLWRRHVTSISICPRWDKILRHTLRQRKVQIHFPPPLRMFFFLQSFPTIFLNHQGPTLINLQPAKPPPTSTIILTPQPLNPYIILNNMSSTGNTNPGNFANRPTEEVSNIAKQGGQASHQGGFASMDPDKQVSFLISAPL